jgi:hypothetical protein
MSDFITVTHRLAKKQHRCSECGGHIEPSEVYERTYGVWDGYSCTFKICKACEEARDWLTTESDWPDDIDGDGHQWFFGSLSDHLREQAREGGPQYRFRAYRYIILMSRRRKAAKEKAPERAA